MPAASLGSHSMGMARVVGLLRRGLARMCGAFYIAVFSSYCVMPILGRCGIAIVFGPSRSVRRLVDSIYDSAVPLLDGGLYSE